MRLLMVSGDRQVATGGKGPFFALQREFSRHFERIDVLCPRPDRPVSVRTIFERVHLHPATCGGVGMARYVARQGAELVRAHGHGLIVSHDYGWFRNGVGSARLARETGVRYVSELHHVPGHPVAADLRERFDRSLARAYVRWARSRTAAFRVVNAIEMPALLRRWGVPEEKILVLPSLYIDLEIFRPSVDASRVEGGASRFDQDVVFVGRMVANKGLERIVDALALLARRGRALSALFVGQGPRLERTRARVRDSGLEGRTRFVEWIDSPGLAEIYRRSRVCVCASTCEGGPRFTVEAMACGTPVVSTPVGVMSELLADGACGELAGFDTESLAEAIERVLADEARRRELGARAVERARPYEYARMIRSYAEGLSALARGADR